MNIRTRSSFAPKSALALALAVGLVATMGAPAIAAPPDVIRAGSTSGGDPVGYLPNSVLVFDPSVPYPSESSTPVGWRDYSNRTSMMRMETPSGDYIWGYCVEIEHVAETNYFASTWDASGISNLGYLLRMLSNSYPNTAEPSLASSAAEKITAVQSAVWYFTDRFVVDSGDPNFAATKQLVDAALAAGPLPESSLSDPVFDPTLSLSVPSGDFVVGEIVGPFTVTSTSASEFVAAGPMGSNLFADAAGTISVAPGTAQPIGSDFWIQPMVLSAGLWVHVQTVAPGVTGFVFDSLDAPNGSGAPQKIVAARATNTLESARLSLAAAPPPSSPPPANLPESGFDVVPVALAAGGLLLLGVVLLLSLRRRASS